MKGQVVIFLMAVGFVLTLGGASLRLYVLTRSILAILREVSPQKEKELTIDTGIGLVDGTLWVRPQEFAAFVKSGDSLGSERLALKLAEYERAQQFTRRASFVFGCLVAAVVIASVVWYW